MCGGGGGCVCKSRREREGETVCMCIIMRERETPSQIYVNIGESFSRQRDSAASSGTTDDRLARTAQAD